MATETTTPKLSICSDISTSYVLRSIGWVPQFYPRRIHRVKEDIREQAAHLPACHSGEDRAVVRCRLVDQDTKEGTHELALHRENIRCRLAPAHAQLRSQTFRYVFSSKSKNHLIDTLDCFPNKRSSRSGQTRVPALIQ